MASKDKLGMSLDDIIQLGRNKRGNGNMRGGGPRGRGGTSVRVRGGSNIRGRGGTTFRGRGAINVRGRGATNVRGRGATNVRGRGATNVRGRGATNVHSRGTVNVRGHRVVNNHPGQLNRGRERSKSRDRGPINIRARGGINIPGRSGRNVRGRGATNIRGRRIQGIMNLRGGRGLQRQFRGNQGMTNSFRSDQIIRQQVLQQKINRARSLKQLMSKNSVSGASDMLTVCITNDLAVKRRMRSRSVPRSGSVNNFARGSFVRRGNNKPYLNRQSLDRLNASQNSLNIVSSEGSVVTTISRRSRASSVGRNRNRRSSSVGRNTFRTGSQGEAVVEQYLPVSTWQPRSGLNMQLQKEIAAIQGKTFVPSTSPTGFANGSTGGLTLSDFRPVPTLTGTTLNERFS